MTRESAIKLTGAVFVSISGEMKQVDPIQFQSNYPAKNFKWSLSPGMKFSIEMNGKLATFTSEELFESLQKEKQ